MKAKIDLVKVTQLCLTLCDPMDCSSSGTLVDGILQARTVEWVAISFSKGSSHPGIEHRSLALQADLLPSEPPGKPQLILLPTISIQSGSSLSNPFLPDSLPIPLSSLTSSFIPIVQAHC